MTSVLFIISSPFQGLCMLEAIEHFKITEYDVLLWDIPEESGTIQTKLLLDDKNIPYSTYKVKHAIFDLIPFVFKRHKYYKNIFIGNYFNITDEGIATFYGSKNYRLFFMDDGTQALSLFSENPRYRYGSKKWEYWFKLYDSLALIKRKQKSTFFTIYDVVSNDFVIVKNNFKLLKNSIKTPRSGCYIIGTNSSVVSFKNYNYSDLLELLLKKLKELYPKEPLYYCPHRRDNNNDAISEWCNNHDVVWVNTRVSVEYDFVMNGINPICVVGFTSNALYTLKMLFSNTDLFTVFYRCESKIDDEETRIIRQGLNQKGINTLYI